MSLLPLMNNEEKKQEIKRIEEHSTRFLKYFSIFWGTLIYFIITNSNSNNLAHKILENLIVIFTGTLDYPGIMMTIFIYSLVLLIVLVLALLVNNMTLGTLDFKSLDELLKKKYENLREGTVFGYLVSIYLILVLIVILLFDNTQVNQILRLLSWITSSVVIILFFIIEPIHRFLSKGEIWAKVWRSIIGLLSMYVAVIFFATQINLKLKMWMVVIFLIGFCFTLPIYTFRLLTNKYSPFGKSVFKFIKGIKKK